MRASCARASPSTRSRPMRDGPSLTLAVPCRTDEPALARTLGAARAALAAAGEGASVELLVCINGPDPLASAALRDLRAFARETAASFAEVTADGVRPAALPPARPPLAVVALLTTRAGKPLAWNVPRRQARAPGAIFLAADVSSAPRALRPPAPAHAGRGAPQPRTRAALTSLDAADAVRLAAYLGMRSLAHVVAWWRYRRGATAGIWRQAATTKRWDPA